ncbi:non-hydrolyzing UDP-N-acetylglucosamine 2-epimerase [Paenibacillus thalictri]|uniref:UDP-N-acetylglucosamine 2-epimerase (Non-hydrolyzing) n=1 Tax=Paenibacillus thalictri TaxID=2527873 RepID=A0A4Q9DIB1_9BACL|nr:UDP-N-acetylglucosamine 2-epimerase (non-hydrolyzing) [Paenibacillus thalictri]TBL70840.1 UDP-N-acetylglucosamine 2-epimerase (non-hydrolyzing) [Paenibacillus thalictri]
MRKIVSVIGTRPQYVKAAAVSRELRKQFHEVLVDTGQHYDYKMAGVFFEELELPRPDYNLGVGSGTHGKQTAAMISGLEELLIKECPDGVLVYGDTNSTLAGALVASKLHIPLFHIEAGLRSFNPKMPEEINRKLTDHISDVLFAPTDTAVRNLRSEGITRNVLQVGDVMLDAVNYYWSRSKDAYTPETFGLVREEYYLATIHRAENTDDPIRLKAIVEAFIKLETPLLLPLHPRTLNRLQTMGLAAELAQSPHIRLIEPVSYLAMLQLERHAKGIITDSGGVQKEAYFAGVPCFTLRSETEWTETLSGGWNVLVDPLRDDLSAIVARSGIPAVKSDVYGDGRATRDIVDHMLEWYEGYPLSKQVSLGGRFACWLQ